MMPENPKIVGIGSTVYDTLMMVDAFPQEDTKQQGIETKVQGGGPCATALVAAQKLGVSAAYMGVLGEDPFGSFMLKDFEHWGIDTRFIRTVPDVTSFHSVVLLNQQNGSRTCVWNRGTVPQPTENDLSLDVIQNAQALHLDGHMLSAAIFAAKKCREWGVKVSLDAGGAYPGIENLLPYVDYLIPSQEFALKITGAATPEEAARQLYDTYHPSLLVLTQGEKGGILLDEKGMRTYDSYRVKVVDSNGCGDTFHGAFLAGKIHGLSNDDACRYASAAAAIKCTRLGARLAMPTDQECRSFLKERGITL